MSYLSYYNIRLYYCTFVIRIAHVFEYYVRMQHSFKIIFINIDVYMFVVTLCLDYQHTCASDVGYMLGKITQFCQKTDFHLLNMTNLTKILPKTSLSFWACGIFREYVDFCYFQCSCNNKIYINIMNISGNKCLLFFKHSCYSSIQRVLESFNFDHFRVSWNILIHTPLTF